MSARRIWITAAAVLVVLVIAGGEWASIRAGIPENHLLDALGGLTYLAAGVVLLDRRPGNRLGALLIAYATVPYLANWGNLPVLLLPMVGFIAAQVAPAIQAHIALAYPSGRLESGADRGFMIAAYGALATFALVVVLFFDPRADGCPTCVWEPAPWPNRAVVLGAQLALQRLDFVLVPAFLALVWLKWRRASPVRRHELAPLWVAVTVIAVVVLLSAFGSPNSIADPFSYFVFELQAVLSLAVPVILVWGLLSARLARSAVSDLLTRMDEPVTPGRLRAQLAAALADPTVELLYRGEGPPRWVDDTGARRELPDGDAPGEHRAATLVSRNGRPLAVLVHDRALDVRLVTGVAAAAGIVLQNERLHADVRAQLAEVLASRQRIAEAADRERRRVERNLHDGAQQRLATLALTLGLLRAQAGPDPHATKGIDEAIDELKLAIQDLRELARGIHPAILTEEGLVAAVESLVRRSPVPVVFSHDLTGRLPATVEATAYYVVAEALANVAKYAAASTTTVVLSSRKDALDVCVGDDGVGGADPSNGSGLQGLQDRVAAAGGVLTVGDADSGRGTVVRATIPWRPPGEVT